MSTRQLIKKLKKDGWTKVKTTKSKGSHHQFKHPKKLGKVTVPHPKKDLPKGTLLSIYKQAGWNFR